VVTLHFLLANELTAIIRLFGNIMTNMPETTERDKENRRLKLRDTRSRTSQLNLVCPHMEMNAILGSGVKDQMSRFN
jgi:hypothetical protein